MTRPACLFLATFALVATTLGAEEPALLDKALGGPLRDVQEVVFCTRLNYDDPHWYANIGYYCDDAGKVAFAGNGQPDTGKLLRYNLRTKQIAPILDDPGGTIRDPQLSYDAAKVLFSWRKNGTRTFHLHEINLDGTGLRQITDGDYDDYEPTYLPDGGIAFVSTRCRQWVNCWMTQVGVIYRCDADGSHVERISANTEHDNTPWPLPDGRLLYTRWEYVDRSQVEFHHLWAMNPDGSSQTLFYGNMRPGVLMIDAKPIPGTNDVLANFSPGHGVNEHAGIATVLTSRRGPDDPAAARPIHKGRLVRDPIPVAAGCFLAARDDGLVLFDGQGGEQLIYRHEGPGRLHEPRPVLPRTRERVLPRRSEPGPPTGRYVLADVNNSRNLPGVERGQIRKLLVLESLPKPVNFSGGPDLTSWLGTFTLERVLGTVPVEPDGSAYFEAPADRQLFFVALDDRDLSVKRMHSFTAVRPGEVQGCVGCHESRTHTPDLNASGMLAALNRPPSPIEGFAGHPDVLDFNRDVQPVLDRHCVACHNPRKREGRVNLAGDLGNTWSHAYFNLLAFLQVADGRNGLGNDPPRTVGSAASPLLRKLEGGHHDVKAPPEDWRTVWLWIESGAPYAGSYAGLRNAEQQNRDGRAFGVAFGSRADVLRKRCASCHDLGGGKGGLRLLLLAGDGGERWNEADRKKVGRPTGAHERIVFPDDPLTRYSTQILLNLSRPELSAILLAPLAKAAGGWGSCGDEVFQSTTDPDYQALLGAIQKGVDSLGADPRWATPGFRPNPQYVREMKRFGILPEAFDGTRDPIDPFDTDQRYWRSLWTTPTPAL